MDPLVIVLFAGMFIQLIVLLAVLAMLYRKCRPGEALIISGMGLTTIEFQIKTIRENGRVLEEMGRKKTEAVKLQIEREKANN